MKSLYKKPTMNVERFLANESVSVCVEGTLQCAIPGADANLVDGSSPTRYVYGSKTWYGHTITFNQLTDIYDRGRWIGRGEHHGLCGNSASITFNSDGGSGYEVDGGQIDYSRPIWDIQGYELSPGTYNVVWKSSDGNTYNHYGTLTITNIDNNRPNHS